MTARSQSEKQDERDVAEFISCLKRYAGATELTREICLELLEYVIIYENPRDIHVPRDIHFYYKLIDKPLNDKNNALA